MVDLLELRCNEMSDKDRETLSALTDSAKNLIEKKQHTRLLFASENRIFIISPSLINTLFK